MITRTRNWITAALAAVLLITLTVLLAGLSAEPVTDSLLNRPSTFFTDDTGARALYLVTKKLLPSAEQWRRPLNFLPISQEPSSATTVIVAGPSKAISKTEAEHLDRWLANGGQLVLATTNGWPLSRAISEAKTEPRKSPLDVPEEQTAEKITYLSTHTANLEWSGLGEAQTVTVTGASVPGGELNLLLNRSFSSVKGTQIIAAAGEKALAVAIPVGEGRIVAVPDPSIVSNRALREADNAIWLVTLAAAWGSGGVLFDEYHHGFGEKRSIGDLMWAFLKTPWGWCVSQMAAAGLFYVFGYRRRFGHLSEPPLPPRTSPLELVEARAGIFQAATAQPLAVQLIAQNLCDAWSKRCGKPVDISTWTDSAKLEDPANSSPRELPAFQALVSKAERGERLSDQEFIAVGQIAEKILQGPVHE